VDSPEHAGARSLPPWAGRAARLLAVGLFLLVGWLTLPKLAPRMKRLFAQREARAEIARREAGRAALSPDEVVRPADVVLIAGVAAGGGLVLLSLGYFVLRPATKSRESERDSDRSGSTRE
jgi:hypothetical protein